MRNLIIEAAGVAGGLAVYALARAILARRDVAQAYRRGHVDGLLAPYEQLTARPLLARVETSELPANVVPLRRFR